jgi:hypothetical protein
VARARGRWGCRLMAVAAAALILLAVVLYYVVPFRVDDEPEFEDVFERFREPMDGGWR